ncbi:hypothetical protein ACHAWO_011459 [Cyclotella atomus]|uniref:Prefoldin subunit 6 n=1 Tax=Cyclotella atomus TaxID=382360 RepID=A0ABD3QXP8_9STRA
MANLGTQAAAEIDTQISKFRALQEELGQYNANFGTLMAQRNENEMVLKELEVCQAEDGEGGECVVYKQVGPVLIKNDLDEAIETVKKRLEFITGEMDKIKTNITKKEEESQQLAAKIQEMQSAMQKAAVEAAKAIAAGQS